MAELRVILTEDGSHTLYSPALKETYHSTHGALRESLHVFIDNGLNYTFSEFPDTNKVRIFEMGFGTGLNATLSCLFSQESRKLVEYYSIEAFPVDAKLLDQLNYFNEDSSKKQLFTDIHLLDWNRLLDVNEYFSLHKISGRIEECFFEPEFYDVVFYDAFAPGKQADMWSVELLKKVIGGLKTGGIFVTYCAKGQLKRDLRSLGCEVQTLPGPPGKKEMVRAVKTNKPYRE